MSNTVAVVVVDYDAFIETVEQLFPDISGDKMLYSDYRYKMERVAFVLDKVTSGVFLRGGKRVFAILNNEGLNDYDENPLYEFPGLVAKALCVDGDSVLPGHDDTVEEEIFNALEHDELPSIVDICSVEEELERCLPWPRKSLFDDKERS